MKTISVKFAAMLTAVLLFSMNTGAVSATGAYTPVKPSKDTHAAYIDKLALANGKTVVVADYIQWYEGASADKVFLDREPDSGLEGAPDGYYIVNDNAKLRKLTVSPKAAVYMQIYNRTGNWEDADIVWNEKISLAAFKKLIAKDASLKDYPYHLVVKDGVVVKIIQQYIP
ncbi:hypothetical protein [Paenibacillus gansuensis]|uniref:Uncharacterized protein n=1 Tax=Paenibacillus gansuensis TaxID=306542 RepID=A0ABW5PDN2_9BACL